ncbi:MAG: hypothetical protein HYT43_02240 [Candidatus Taylorbacteria bacterium]|nr:hypothetical protein [Candidatus Taylorbacteria bacterium]
MRATKTKSEREKNEYFHFGDFDKCAEVALYYGFTPIAPPPLSRADSTKTGRLLHEAGGGGEKELAEVEARAAIIRTFITKFTTIPQPVSLYCGDPPHPRLRRRGGGRRFELSVIGTAKSIAEATIIKTAFEIFKENGYQNIYVELNSTGDSESFSRFARELSAFYRKHAEHLPPPCRQTARTDVFALLNCEHEKCLSLREEMPAPVGFLSESERAHFREVLEFLEMLEIPYKISSNLIGNRFLNPQTVFEIKAAPETTGDKPSLLASGSRFSALARKLGWRHDLPVVDLLGTLGEGSARKRAVLKVRKPSVYFIQLGYEAKLKSLMVIEILRQARIPLYQSLTRDKFLSQISLAESMNIPYCLIMGQKEAIENSVIIRHMQTRSQETVPISELPRYLKNL